MKKYVILFITTLSLLFFADCAHETDTWSRAKNFINKPTLGNLIDSGEIVNYIPRFWSNFTWTEISEDEAKTKWNTFNTAIPPTPKLWQFTKNCDYPIRLYRSCSITPSVGTTTTGQQVWDCFVQGAARTLNDYPVWDINSRTSSDQRKVYKANEDETLLKFEDRRQETINGYNGYMLQIFHGGWIVEYKIGNTESADQFDEVYVYTAG